LLAYLYKLPPTTVFPFAFTLPTNAINNYFLFPKTLKKSAFFSACEYPQQDAAYTQINERPERVGTILNKETIQDGIAGKTGEQPPKLYQGTA
jgi:hypothetical protein